MLTPFHQQRKAGNTKILIGLVLFSAGVYFTSMWRMGQNDFKDVNDFGFPVEENKAILQKRPRGSGSS